MALVRPKSKKIDVDVSFLYFSVRLIKPRGNVDT